MVRGGLGVITMVENCWQYGGLGIFLQEREEEGQNEGFGGGREVWLQDILCLNLSADAGAVGGADPDC